jgi:hypothetical protein
MKAVFLDTETTGLHPYKGHEVWEIGAIVADDHAVLDDVTPYLFRVYPSDMALADPGAIAVNRFYERTAHLDPPDPNGDGIHPQGERWSAYGPLSRWVSTMFEGALVIGNNPSFDLEMLEMFVIRNNNILAPFHRKVNVIDLALGRIFEELRWLKHATSLDHATRRTQLEATAQFPHSSTKVLKAAGCPDNEDPHTALGDAWHVFEAFRHLTGL